MPKKKSYDVTLVLSAIDRYFNEVCFHNVKRLKMTQICKYLKENGFPEINDRKLNRDEQIREHIVSLKAMESSESIQEIISYSPLNVDDFLKTNSNINKLKAALTILDSHYGDICKYAIEKVHENQDYKEQVSNLKADIKRLNTLNEEQINELKRLKRVSKESEMYRKKYMKLIKTTLLPEVANEILRRDDILLIEETIISEEGFKDFVLDNSMVIQDEIKKIDKMEDKFNNSIINELFESIERD